MSAPLAALRLVRVAPDDADRDPAPGAWVDVCALEEIVPDTGVCALVGRRQVAVVRVGGGERVHAIDNFDPISRAFVLSRGIVGDKGGVAKICSPIFKQGFDLATGQCLEKADVRVPVYQVRVRGGRVEIGPELPPGDGLAT